MSKIVIIVAHGPNDIQIPCLICESREKAEEKLKEAGLEYQERWDGWYNHYGDDLTPEGEATERRVMLEHFFTYFYGGCGGIGCFKIEEIEFGEKFTGWDLD